MTVQVKICGLKTPDAVEAAQDAGASFLGFVFCEKSPRHITYDVARELGQLARIPKVAVTVNATNDELTQIIASLNPEYIQLHGTESNERAQEIKDKFGVKLIKALTNDQQLTTNNQLYDFLLFDSPGGGTGKQFDYTNFKAPKTPWFLSGGLNAANVAEAIAQTGAKYVDVSSGVESSKGVKDVQLIKQFISKVHAI